MTRDFTPLVDDLLTPCFGPHWKEPPSDNFRGCACNLKERGDAKKTFEAKVDELARSAAQFHNESLSARVSKTPRKNKSSKK